MGWRQHGEQLLEKELLDGVVGLAGDLHGGARKGGKVGLEGRRLNGRTHEYNLEAWALGEEALGHEE